jgi:hypothetical protein
MADHSAQPESNPGVLLEEKPNTPTATSSGESKIIDDSELSPERVAKFSDFLVSIHSAHGFERFIAHIVEQRVFSYARSWDFVLLALGVAASVGAGVVSAWR